MEALKFDIVGKFAHFKNPENNKVVEFSYEHIPRTVLIGMLGAVIGLRGKQQERELGYIEYWKELKDTKISIVPHKPKWRKHLDEMVNSTGFSNNKQNQILIKQVLEDVRWTIYVLKESMSEKNWSSLTNMLLKRKSSYPLFLGKMEYKARIENIDIADLNKIESADIEKCDSLLLDKFIIDTELDKCEEHLFYKDRAYDFNFYLPYTYNEIGLYELEKIRISNLYLEVKGGVFYTHNDLVLNFY